MLPRTLALTDAERRRAIGVVAVILAATAVASMVPSVSAIAVGLAAGLAAGVLVAIVATWRARPAVAPSALSDYIAVLAHELSGPIVNMGVAAQVLAKELHGRAAERSALGIAEEARLIYALLESLSDLSAFETGRLSLSLRAIDLAELVRGGVALIPSEQHILRIDIPNEEIVVHADDRRVRQVLRNLVDNAAKYSVPGTQIEVRVGKTADHRSAIVQVRDHGPGVPPGERGKLFDKFVRLSTAAGTRGSGLGLYLCRAIVTEHGGDLWGEWPTSGGTIFSFTLPLTRAPVTPRRRQEVAAG